MPSQYSATDHRNGLTVSVTGDFPDDPEDRVRIARASNLFTRLMATMLITEDPSERRERFRAIETQLEIAEALIRGDMAEVQQLIRRTLTNMGVSEEQLRDVEQELERQLGELGRGELTDIGGLFGSLSGNPPGGDPAPETTVPLDDEGLPDAPRADVSIEGLPDDLDPSVEPREEGQAEEDQTPQPDEDEATEGSPDR